MEKKELPDKLKKAITTVMHPAINFSLVELGIIREYHLEENNIVITFAFPFPDIPIKDMLISSVEEQVKNLGYSMKYQTDLMTDQERESFLEMENQGWN